MSNPLTRFRVYAPSALARARVDRDERVIHDIAIARQGEASGHDLWLDGEFLSQIVRAGQSHADKGVKVRFTHPGLCSDGLGTFLGHTVNYHLDGATVRADLRFSDTTPSSPNYDRDPAEYLMDMAEREPDAFGASIVFSHDTAAEDRFETNHADERGKFASPDPENISNYRHARLAKLHAADIVDTPAATDGIFSDHEEAAFRAETALAYALGLDDTPPPPEAIGNLDPKRMREWTSRFLARRGLTLVPHDGDQTMSDTPKTGQDAGPDKTPASDAPTPESIREEVHAQFTALQAAFPDDPKFVAAQFAAGHSVTEAKAEYAAVLTDRLAETETARTELSAKVTALEAQLAEMKAALLDGDSGVEAGSQAKTFGSLVEAAEAFQAAHEGTSFEDAVRKCADLYPALYAASRGEG